MKPWEQAQKEQDEAAASKPALKPWEQARAAAGQDQYKGSVLPFSVGPDGKSRFDSDAGIIGSIKRAVTLPREVYEGKVDLNTDEATGRVLEAATVASPLPAPLRAGERIIPGVAGQKTVRGKVAPPSSDELFETAGRQYDAVRDAGVDYKSKSIADLAGGLKQGLERDGILDVPEGAPSTHKIIGMLSSPPSGSVAPIQQVEAARRAFQGLAQSSTNATERGAAKRAIGVLSDFIERADPASVVAGPAAEAGRTLGQARGNYAAGKRSDQLTGVERTAQLRAAAANSGGNEGNSIRSRLASLLSDKKVRPGHPIRGYTAEETAAIEGVVRGSKPANITRRIGNIMGGGGGLGAAVTGGLGAGIGAAAGGPVGAGIGGITAPIIGGAIKSGSNALTRRALRNVDKQTRSRSPLMTERQSQAPYTPRPAYTRNAILRALLLAEQGDQ